jgi:hypothetical protein
MKRVLGASIFGSALIANQAGVQVEAKTRLLRNFGLVSGRQNGDGHPRHGRNENDEFLKKKTLIERFGN